MIERMTYLGAAAAAIVSWLITLLVADLTSVPILYHTSSTVDVTVGSAAVSGTTLELTNLSRSKPVASFVVFAKGRQIKPGNGDDCTVNDGKIYPSGVEWTSGTAASGGRLEVPSLMPGSVLWVAVELPRGCTAAFSFELPTATPADPKAGPVRVVSSGLESFLLLNWLKIIGVLLVLAGLAYAAAFIVACIRSLHTDRREALVKRAADEAAVVEAGARKAKAEVEIGKAEAEVRKAAAERKLADTARVEEEALLGGAVS